jgi:transcriptional regulator with XRE-family HTH domain
VPHSSAPEPRQDPAELLFFARMYTGLTQAEVAHRAGITRTTVSAYERRARQPTLKVLRLLLAGCGMRLWLNAIPEAGLEDEPIHNLLDLAPFRRLGEALEDALIWIAEKLTEAPDLLVIVGGKAAARLHGAVIDVGEIELLAEDKRAMDQVMEWLQGAEFAAAFLVRIPDHFEGIHARAETVSLFEHLPIRIASPGDCTVSWDPRDLDHLALQRARAAQVVSSAGQTPFSQ